jgi:hypothetical protein
MDPHRIAIDYYFGDLQYWKLPAIAADALDCGYDGPALRRLAGVSNPTLADFDFKMADSAFREMGVDAPIPGDKASLALAVESATKALNGESNVFDEATYIRIHICHLKEPPECLKQIVSLSKASRNAPRSEWPRLEAELTEAFTQFLKYNVSAYLGSNRKRSRRS